MKPTKFLAGLPAQLPACRRAWREVRRKPVTSSIISLGYSRVVKATAKKKTMKAYATPSTPFFADLLLSLGMTPFRLCCTGIVCPHRDTSHPNASSRPVQAQYYRPPAPTILVPLCAHSNGLKKAAKTKLFWFGVHLQGPNRVI